MSREKKQSNTREGFTAPWYALFSVFTFLVLLICVGAGSVRIPVRESFRIILNALLSRPEDSVYASILIKVRLPRVLAVAFSGASLSIAGAAMQGLLKNPLADGTTLGVSSGASLGAALAITFGITFPALPFAGTAVMAVLFSFGSLALILFIAYRLDSSLSTNTIILIGVIFSMLVSSILSLLITFASEKLKTITFWTMGSLAGSRYSDALLLFLTLAVSGAVLLRLAPELNAFAIGEDNARHIGIDVKKVRLTVLVFVSLLIGICVSVGGTIGFVGLVTPHMVRLVTGPNHKKVLPASLFFGASFLMLCDLAARTLFAPLELPIGTVTSLIGAVLFILIFYRSRMKRA